MDSKSLNNNRTLAQHLTPKTIQLRPMQLLAFSQTTPNKSPLQKLLDEKFPEKEILFIENMEVLDGYLYESYASQPTLLWYAPELSPTQLQTIQQTIDQHPHLRMVVLVPIVSAQQIQLLLDNGIKGLIQIGSSGSIWQLAIEIVGKGGLYIDYKEAWHKRAIQSNSKTDIRITDSLFTSREKQVIQMIVDQKSTQEIADILYLSPKTVELARTTLLKKMGVKNVAGLVAFALKYGLVEDN